MQETDTKKGSPSLKVWILICGAVILLTLALDPTRERSPAEDSEGSESRPPATASVEYAAPQREPENDPFEWPDPNRRAVKNAEALFSSSPRRAEVEKPAEDARADEAEALAENLGDPSEIPDPLTRRPKLSAADFHELQRRQFEALETKPVHSFDPDDDEGQRITAETIKELREKGAAIW